MVLCTLNLEPKDLLMKPDIKKVSEGEMAILIMVGVATTNLSDSLEIIKEKNQEQQHKIDDLVKAQESLAKKVLDELEKQRLLK
jgi:hypothetical protein